MNCIIFDEEIYYDSGGQTGILSKDKLNTLLTGPERGFSVAVIDTLQKQVAAPDKSASRRGEVIASSFSSEYLTQSERITANLFQVMAVEKPKVAEVYKSLGSENIRMIVPYGVALREFLKGSGVFEQGKIIVFLDHLENQVLLTIFHNQIFTAPRRLPTVSSRVVTELHRSQENFKAAIKEKEEASFLIVTNSQEIKKEIASSGLEKEKNILYFSDPYPALTGLKQGKFSMHYMLPEHFIRLRKLKVIRKRLFSFGIMAGVLAVLLILFMEAAVMNKNAIRRLESLGFTAASQNEALRHAYAFKYRDILRHKAKSDFSYLVNSFVNTLPLGCVAEKITIRSMPEGFYRFEGIVLQDARHRPFDKTRLSAAFRPAGVENILVKGNPAVRVTLDFF